MGKNLSLMKADVKHRSKCAFMILITIFSMRRAIILIVTVYTNRDEE
jgi:hypothetical protein